AAARAQMDEGGYLALNMRDIAAGAGVSPGTLYSYFATKEELFATLFAEAIDAHTDRIRPSCDAPTSVEALLADLMVAYLDLYGHYGRYFTLWSWVVADHTDADHRFPPELSAALRRAAADQAAVVGAGIDRAAAAEGRRVRDRAAAMSFLWAVQNGLGDHVTS